MRCETTSSLEECALRARSTHGMHHTSVGVNIVIGVVLGEVLVARVVPLVVDAVIGLALSLMAHVVVVVFVVAILHRIFLYGRYTLYRKEGSSSRPYGSEGIFLPKVLRVCLTSRPGCCGEGAGGRREGEGLRKGAEHAATNSPTQTKERSKDQGESLPRREVDGDANMDPKWSTPGLAATK